MQETGRGLHGDGAEVEGNKPRRSKPHSVVMNWPGPGPGKSTGGAADGRWEESETRELGREIVACVDIYTQDAFTIFMWVQCLKQSIGLERKRGMEKDTQRETAV